MTISSSIWCFYLLASAVLAIQCSVCSCIQFNYPTFDTNSKADFSFTTGSDIANGALQITPSTGNIAHKSGRVYYAKPFKLWKGNRTVLTSFKTSFVLNILPMNQTGEGLAFILTNKPTLPTNSSGQWLGIVNNQTNGSALNRVVAVEFDTRKSYTDDLDGNHVGLDINSIESVGQVSFSNVSIKLSSGNDVSVSMEYNGSSHILDFSAVQSDGMQNYLLTLQPNVDLSQYLLEDVYVGFAGSTSEFTQLNQIKSWNFSIIDDGMTGDTMNGGRKPRAKPIWLLAILIPFSVCIALAFYIRRLRQHRGLVRRNIEQMIDGSANGPVKFKLKQLRYATDNFNSSRKLGKGGFGTVYRGFLENINMEVAVKRIASDGPNSSRGEQEFLAEVNTISKLSHRNLVKLIGWSHEQGELLLVYELFPVGSLDKLLYTKGSAPSDTSTLTWERRYNILCGVASALDYLHHGSSKRILHRDVKASNVMLDEQYNARLGDFGLARVIQHDGDTHHSTQAIAGTRGYIAPESYFTGHASPETDVYAFGVFIMEVASRRRPGNYVQYDEGEGSNGGVPMYIVDWIWELYGERKTLDAADATLNGEYDELQMNRVLRLALSCCHPNPRERPSMRIALQVLIDGAPAPEPPPGKPAFVWPLDREQQEPELPHVGLLFLGGQLSFSSIGGR